MSKLKILIYISTLCCLLASCRQDHSKLLDAITDTKNRTMYVSLKAKNLEGIHFSPDGRQLDFGSDGQYLSFDGRQYKSLNLMIINPEERGAMVHYVNEYGNCLYIIKPFWVNNQLLDFSSPNVVVLPGFKQESYQRQKEKNEAFYVAGDTQTDRKDITTYTLTEDEEFSLGLNTPENSFLSRSMEEDEMNLYTFDTLILAIHDTTAANELELYPLYFLENFSHAGEIYSLIYDDDEYTQGWNLNLGFLYNSKFPNQYGDFEQKIRNTSLRLQEKIGNEQRILCLFINTHKEDEDYIIYIDFANDACLFNWYPLK